MLKALKFFSAGMLITLFLFSNLFAQEPPSWLQTGNLQSAYNVRDFLEIPNVNVILACGKYDYYSNGNGIWKSTDGGVTWALKGTSTHGTLYQFAYDSLNHKIFVCGNGGPNLFYSLNYGDNWASISNPVVGGGASYSIQIIGQKLYVAFHDNTFYSALLYRLDFSDPDPANWFWEFVMQYPQLDHIMRLTVKDDILYIFGKDKTTDGLRIFTYDPTAARRPARRMETVVIKDYPQNSEAANILPSAGSPRSENQ